MQEFQLNFNTIIKKLKRTRRAELNFNIITGILKTLSIILGLILLVSIIEAVAHGDTIFRGILAAILFFVVFVSMGVFFGPHLAKQLNIIPAESIDKLALRIGWHYPDIQDRLSNSIQIIDYNERNNKDSDLAYAAFNDIANISINKDFSIIINKKELKKSLIFFFIISAVTIASFSSFQSILGSSLHRVLNFGMSFTPPPPFELTIEPINQTLSRGDKAVIKIIAEGKAPDNVTLLIKEIDQKNYDSYVLRLQPDNTYTYEIPSLKKNIIFYGNAYWLNSSVNTKIGKINVTDKPIIRAMNGNIIYPSYTRITPRQFYEDNGDISALIGSRVDLTIYTNKQLKNATIIYEQTYKLASEVDDSILDSTKKVAIQMKSDGRKATGSFRINNSGVYYITITDEDDRINEDIIKYQIIALKDEYPQISLIEPQGDSKVSENALLPLKIAISDDYGFSKMLLHYKLILSKYTEPDRNYSSIEIPFLTTDLTAEVPYLWDLNKIGISPEDKYEFYIEIFDNDIISGPKSARTEALTVRLPSLDEILQSAKDAQKQIEKELEKALKQADQIRKEMQELNRELLKDFNRKELDWKEKKNIEDIVKKQQELAEKLSDVKDKLEDVSRSLQDNKAISQETLNKFLELQRLMSEVNSPELQRMQDRLEQALKQISPEQMQKLLKEVQFDEEKFRKSIERTLKILKRLQAEQKVDALNKRAEEMLNKQEDLTKQTENANPNDDKKRNELSDLQKSLQKDIDKVTKELSELEQLMKEIGDDMPIEELQKAGEELNSYETSAEMQNASNQIKKGDMKQAKSSQRKATSNLNKFSEQMDKVKQEMQDRNAKEVMRKLQKNISDLLKLSKEQEALKQSTQTSDFNSLQLSTYAEIQSNLFQSLVNIANAMMALSEKTFAITPEMGKAIGDALEEMQNATEQLANRRPNNALKSQVSAMSSLNQAASQMQNMLSMMQNQGAGACDNPGGSGMGQTPGGMGLGERLQQLAGQQQAINQAMQQSMQQSNQGQLSLEQQAEYGRIAQEQGRARKTLQELADEQKKNPDSEKRLLGDLERIAKDMQEVVTDLISGDIKPETLNRQERILSRLLDATRSINNRDYEKNRESRPGREVLRMSPAEIDLMKQEGNTRALQELLRQIQEGYTKDYENLIKRYFEAIQNNSKANF